MKYLILGYAIVLVLGGCMGTGETKGGFDGSFEPRATDCAQAGDFDESGNIDMNDVILLEEFVLGQARSPDGFFAKKQYSALDAMLLIIFVIIGWMIFIILFDKLRED